MCELFHFSFFKTTVFLRQVSEVRVAPIRPYSSLVMISRKSSNHFYQLVRLCELFQVIPYRSVVPSQFSGFLLEASNGFVYHAWFLLNTGILIAGMLFCLWKALSPELGIMTQVLGVALLTAAAFISGSQILFFMGHKSYILGINSLRGTQYTFGQDLEWTHVMSHKF